MTLWRTQQTTLLLFLPQTARMCLRLCHVATIARANCPVVSLRFATTPAHPQACLDVYVCVCAYGNKWAQTALRCQCFTTLLSFYCRYILLAGTGRNYGSLAHSAWHKSVDLSCIIFFCCFAFEIWQMRFLPASSLRFLHKLFAALVDFTSHAS